MLHNEAEAVRLVGIDRVCIHGTCTPSVIATDSVNLVIDVDVDIVSLR